MPNELDRPSLHETLSVLAHVHNFDGHPFLARIMFLNSIIPNSFKMKKGEDRETKRKKGRLGKEGGREKRREGRKQRKSKRQEGKKNNGVKQTGRASRRNEVPNKASLRRTLRITKAGPLHFVYLLRCQGQNQRSQSSDLPYHQEVGSLAGEHHSCLLLVTAVGQAHRRNSHFPQSLHQPQGQTYLAKG